MYILDVFYYNYYNIYKKVINDPDPHIATLLSLSACEGLLINAPIHIIALKRYCYQIPVWIEFSLVLLVVYCNYLVLLKSGKAKKIIRAKPILKNQFLSELLTCLFFLISISWLFWGPIYGKYLLENCR